MTAFVFFLIGLFFLLLGSKGVVQNALALAGRIRISPLVVGLTAVSIGTSLPEISISFFGGLDKATELALGNIVGSNIANIGLVFGLALTIHHLYIGGTKTQKNMLLYFFLSLFFFAILIFGKLQILQGTLFLVLGFLVLRWQIILGKRGAEEEDKEVVEKLGKAKRSLIVAVILFIISLLAVTLGGKMLVDSGAEIARLLDIPQLVIGMTAVAIGTSLPELAVSLTGVAAREEKLVIGNILGSNIYNILLGGGILGIFGTSKLESLSSLIFFIIFSIFFCFLIYFYKGREVPRYFGPAMLFLYAIYLLVIFIS